MKFRNSFEQSGSALVLVMMFIAIALASSILFLNSSIWRTGVADISKDSSEIRYQVESVYNKEQAKLDRAVDGIILNGRLPVINASLADETAFSIVGEYQGNELQFLRDIVEAQSVSGGVQNPSHEFADFDAVFPTTWTDLTPNDQEFVEVRYTIEPRPLVQETNPINQYIFEYSVRLETRGYSSSRFINFGSDSSSIVRVSLTGAPFSQWSLFRSQTNNPSGAALYFAGGDTSAQIQEVFRGPVHTNSRPNFYGHPAFYDLFTSAAPYGTWNFVTAAGYSGSPTFETYQSGAALTTPMPTEIFNTTRMAAGDPDEYAATNNATVSNANLVDWVEHYAGGAGSGSGGSLPGGTSSLPNGIYIPVDHVATQNPTGGIYVQGNARIVMDVVQGSGDFTATQWGQIQAAHQGCKFQKIRITSLESGVLPREVYVGDEPCDVTYVFEGTGSSATHALLNGRINGNIHVNGEINELGGASRTRPAVVQDFGLTVSALKDVYIKNDLQYEDAEYVTMDAAGNMGSTVVATPTGAVGGSGIAPTAQDIAAQISEDSKTVLGIVSVKRNVMIHGSAPGNINIHGALYAGNSAALSGGLGCGSGSNAGCGFGVVNYSTVTGRGTVKVLGSISEYRSQGVGVMASPPKGYSRRYSYDERFRQDLTPPAFPISNQLQAYPEILPVKTWRISENSED